MHQLARSLCRYSLLFWMIVACSNSNRHTLLLLASGKISIGTYHSDRAGEEGKLIKESRKLINNRLAVKADEADGRVHLVPLEKII